MKRRLRPNWMRDKSHTPRKRFGQNFLKSEAILRQIIDAIQPHPEDHILEIGPGQGVLTKPLLEYGATIDCLEIDRDLVDFLRKQFEKNPRFHIHSTDALKFDLNQLAVSVKPKSIRVVGNLPYNITTPLLFHLLNYCDLIRDMHFMLQKEVVERLTASPNSKAFGRLTLMIQYFCKTEYLFTVPSTAFKPAPKVKSAFMRLEPYSVRPFSVKDFKLFETLTAAAFNQRRKMLSTSLKGVVAADILSRLFSTLNIDPFRPAPL